MTRIKVVLIGDSGVGKTALFSRFQGLDFSEKTVSTVGGAFVNCSVVRDDGIEVNMGIWDTAGQEAFQNVVPMYFSKADFIVIVYSIDSHDSYQKARFWYNKAKERAPPNAKIIIVANKIDLESEDSLKTEDLMSLTNELGAVLSISTSAKTGFGIDSLKTSIAEMVSTEEEEDHDEGALVEIRPAGAQPSPPNKCRC